MPYCPVCAVEVEARLQTCPLCQQLLSDEMPEITGEYPAEAPEMDTHTPRPRGTVRGWSLGIVAALGLLAMLITALIDARQDHAFSWSFYSHASVLAGIGFVALAFFAIRRPIFLFNAAVILTGCLLVTLDGIVRPLSWSTSMGLPILLGVYVTFGVWTYLVVRFRPFWVPGVAFLISAAAVFCVLLDVWIARQLKFEFFISWSIPVLFWLLPVAVAFPFFVRRLRRHARWRRLFDI